MTFPSKRTNEDNKGKVCKMEGCTFLAKAKGYCYDCYFRVRRMKVKANG